MKQITLSPALLVTGLTALLTGCGSTSEGSPTPAPVTVTATATPSGAASGKQAADASESGSEQSASGQEAERSLSSRGALIKQWGDKAGIGSPDNPGEQMVSFTLGTPTKGFTCTGEFASAPENGVIVAIPAELTIARGASEYGIDGALLHPMNFRVIGKDGKTASVDMQTSAALQCLDDKDRPNYDSGDGESTSGTITLDLPAAEGTLLLEEVASGSTWEWPL